MALQIAIPKERRAGEPRVAATPETVKKFKALGAEVAVQGLTGGSGETSYGQVLARGGVLVADDLALYATAGYGIDLGVPTGTPVHAAEDGTVAIAGWVGGYGNYICINHGGGFSTCYGHNSRLGVSVGQRVSKGQVIAASGNTGNSTGPHIHFETRVNGVQKDPMGYL